MHYQRPRGSHSEKKLRTRAEKSVVNRLEKKELVENRCTHGILVYANGEPVGWCQYGPKGELPRIDTNRNYQDLAPKDGTKLLWRITCFAVHKKHRRRGVATTALKAALESIRSQGGGLVEAYPLTRWESRAFGNESTHGTRSMFEKAGFKVVAPFGSNKFSASVLMRRSA
jgi:GNAT superfamily N-acetyltransferase